MTAYIFGVIFMMCFSQLFIFAGMAYFMGWKFTKSFLVSAIKWILIFVTMFFVFSFILAMGILIGEWIGLE